MRKSMFTISLLSLLFLSGCTELLDYLEGLLDDTLQNTLELSNESITKETEKYVFSFEINTADLTNFDATIDMEIVCRTSSLFSETSSFTVVSYISSYSFDIYLADIDQSRETTGEFTFLVQVDGKRYQETIDIYELELRTGDSLYIDEIITEASSTYAKESISNNNWANHSTTSITNMLSLYDEINEKIADFMENGSTVTSSDYVFLTITTTKYNLTSEQALEAYYAVVYDNPIYYFIGKSISYSYASNDLCTTLKLKVSSQYTSKTVRDTYNDAIVIYVEDCVDLVDGLTDDLDIALEIHDKIISDVDYDYTFGVYAYDIIGVVANEGPVCESYAETYFMLLNYFDVPCYLVLCCSVKNDKRASHLHTTGQSTKIGNNLETQCGMNVV